MTIALVALLALAPTTAAPVPLRTAFHVHTSFSDGRHSLSELARAAAAADIDAIVLADHYETEIRYGLPFFRETLFVAVRPPALAPGSLAAYVAEARRVEEATGVLVLPGVELTPHYAWRGSLLGGSLRLEGAHRHLVAVLPEGGDAAAIAPSLYSAGAPASRRYGLGSLGSLWPLALGLWAARRALRPGERRVRSRFFVVRRRRSRGPALVALAVAVVLAARAWPFTVPRFDPYGADPGARPFQAAIDAARAGGALCFWAHPEAAVSFRHDRYPVEDHTDAYPELVEATTGATGFAALYEGYRRVAAPGGVWDRLLARAARGGAAPLWAVGELDLHELGEGGGKFLGEVETIVLAESRSRAALLDALRRGAAYAVWQGRESRLVVERFALRCDGREAGPGERLAGGTDCRIVAALSQRGEAPRRLDVRLVADGVVVASAALAGERLAVEWPVAAAPDRTRVLRLDGLWRGAAALHTNPIFLDPKEAAP